MSEKPGPEQPRRRLTAEQHAVSRQKATERPFAGEHLYRKQDGTCCCICSRQPVIARNQARVRFRRAAFPAAVAGERIRWRSRATVDGGRLPAGVR